MAESELKEIREIKLGDKTVKLDPQNMEFNEHTLSEYLEKEAGWYNYFGACLSDAEYLLSRAELEYDVLYSERFKEHKENGCSDKLSEASAKADGDVEAARLTFLANKHKVRLLQQHLRAWDSDENSQSRGHFLRKEMDKLNKDIYGHRPDNYLERKLDDIVKEVNASDVGDLMN